MLSNISNTPCVTRVLLSENQKQLQLGDVSENRSVELSSTAFHDSPQEVVLAQMEETAGAIELYVGQMWLEEQKLRQDNLELSKALVCLQSQERQQARVHADRKKQVEEETRMLEAAAADLDRQIVEMEGKTNSAIVVIQAEREKELQAIRASREIKQDIAAHELEARLALERRQRLAPYFQVYQEVLPRIQTVQAEIYSDSLRYTQPVEVPGWSAYQQAEKLVKLMQPIWKSVERHSFYR